MARALPALLAGTIACLLLGCNSGSSEPHPSGATPEPAASAPASQGSTRRHAEAPALLVQCGLRRGTINPQTGQPWYDHGKVLPLSGSGSGSHDAEFSTWLDANSTIGGTTLSGWSQWTAANDTRPSAVCSPSVSASALAGQLYPGRPNPWPS